MIKLYLLFLNIFSKKKKKSYTKLTWYLKFYTICHNIGSYVAGIDKTFIYFVYQEIK